MASGPIYWHQGLFLLPQHFQKADMHTEEMFQSLTKSIRPFFWGFHNMVIDEALLEGGVLHFTEFSVLFPSMGFWLHCPDNCYCGASPIPKNMVSIGESLTVYLGIKILNKNGQNVTTADNSEELAQVSTRYAVQTNQKSIDDLYSALPNSQKAQVRELTYVTNIYFGDEHNKKNDTLFLPMVKLIRHAENFALDKEFVPPCITMENWQTLNLLAEDIYNRVQGKVRQLDSYKSLATRANMGDMTTLFLMLRSLTRFLPRLGAIVTTQQIPPHELYCLFRELLAELSIFSREYNSFGEDMEGRVHIIPYNHTDMYPAFQSCVDIIKLLLNAINIAPAYTLRFVLNPPFYEAKITTAILQNPQNIYWLVLNSDTFDLHLYEESIYTSLKLSTLSRLSLLMVHALQGLKFTIVNEPPLGFVKKRNSLYIQILSEGELWEEVKNEKSIAFIWEDSPNDIEAHFVITT